jgi:hypothetical protein
VQVTSAVNVRDVASVAGVLLGSHASGDLGTITNGPTTADSYTWWNVNYDSSPQGWSVENNLELMTPVPPSGGNTPPSPPSDNSLPTTITPSDSGSLDIRWTPPAGSEPENGYTVEVAGANGEIEKRFVVPRGTHGVQVSELPNGAHKVSISENDKTGSKKVAEKGVVVGSVAKTDSSSSLMSIATKWLLPIGALALLGLGLYFGKRYLANRAKAVV